MALAASRSAFDGNGDRETEESAVPVMGIERKAPRGAGGGREGGG